MKRLAFLLFMLFALCLVGCSRESEFVNPETEDFLTWTKEYLDAGQDFYAGGSIKEYENAIKDIAGEDLLAEHMELAKELMADIEINGKVYSGHEKLQFFFGDDAIRTMTTVDISRVYDDMNPDRDFFKYVVVRQCNTVFNENDEEITNRVIPESNRTILRKFWFQEIDDRWLLYSIEKMRFFPDENGEYTKAEFNGEPITFTHYKDFEIILNQ